MKPFTFILFFSLFLIILTNNIDTDLSSHAVIVCPDGVSMCPSTSTCCISIDGDYSCCPLEEGVCCSDHIHCCPQHYKCDLKIFKCDRTWKAKLLQMKPSLNKN
ncbi:unnamed protein product [Rotaria sordida]|uniref:Granulins domain-containing protein n=1 Tax=Rotaria sordida TaxID=392033 RepID=A0A818LFZ3_9BILA|nr:unnamed protein product [Rotaria sordida]CAF0929207.1 unnamed protein product [Rotaria sordida]CAF0984531.1 unnamed protein product [Rotaria sordida]CAF1045116.1 unnamed protein product [Rotaria sordida]CAF1212567.1 unnamed protein product [Rotaria sordida]